jgi:nascent polypeptide-associated complex subunit alpha
MFPRGMSPKKLQQMMKQMGINVETIDNVIEVKITTDDREIVFKDAEVSIMDVKGSKTYQVVGTPEEREISKIKREDIELVMEKAGVSEEEAKKALEETDGDLAGAIMKLAE